ncbi:MAG: pitrilysin family protein [Proteobacteria bacterium]|nr:pitrilysin family protein [Pseudomonadota bacterium]
MILIAAAGAAVQDVETHRFDNGLTLHVAPGHPAPVAAIQAWVGVGSADESPQLAGAAHVVEHMLFKGSMRYGRGELVHAIERGGGEINAWTSLDQTVLHAVIGRDHVEAALDAIGDTLLEPTVDPGELARERQVILEEIRHGTDDPSRSVVQNLFATAFVAHPYRRPVIGTADTVASLRERELVEFFRRYYVADNLTLVVAGDVDPARVRRAVDKRFRAMPSGRPQRNVAAEPRQTATRAIATLRDLGEAYVSVGFHVPAARHPDLAALDVAALLLGQNESARLDQLRVRDNLVTSAHAHVHSLRDPGLFVLSATAKPGDARRAVGALVEQAAKLADEVTDTELEKACVAAETGFVRELETVQGRARSLGWYSTVAGDPQFGHVYLDRVRAMRRHDLSTAMRRYLRADNASVAAILPKRRASTTVFARDATVRVRKALATAPVQVAIADRRVVLPNGARLIVRRDPSVPVVAMRAVWQGGQRVEDAAHAGSSTLIARLITRGCVTAEGTIDAAKLADRVDRLGGSLGAVAGRNSFAVAAEWLSRSWKPGFALFAACIANPTFADLERERRGILDDQAAQQDSPSQLVFGLFTRTLYGAHPYSRDVLGTPAAINAMTPAELRAFHALHHPPSAMVLTVVGDVDVDEVVALATAQFTQPPTATGSKPQTIVAPKPPVFDGRSAAAREVYQYLDRAQGHLVIGFPGTTIDAPDRFALEVLISMLGGQSGRLFAELREKRALVYRISAHSIEGIDPGFVAIYLSCSPDKLDEANRAVREVLDRVRTAGVTPDELARAQSSLIGRHQIAMQRRSAIANAIAYHEAYGLGWQTWDAYDDAIRSVRQADVANAVATYLRDDRAITATVRPKVETPAAKKRGKILTPARPTTPPPRRTPARPRGNA